MAQHLMPSFRPIIVEPKIKKMKSIYPKSAVAAFITFILFAFAVGKPTYQTDSLRSDNDGYLTINIWDPVKGDHYKLEQAQKDAINCLLYAGFSGNDACVAQKPILANSTDAEAFRKIEEAYFAKTGKWTTLIRSSALATTLPMSLGNKHWRVYQVSIAKDLLRKDLEEQKIIKSLTTGF